MASKAEQELLTVAGREVAISNPSKVLFPQAGYTKLDATTSRSPTARCAARAAGRTCSCAIRTASTASSSIRSARPQSRPAVDRGRRAAVSRRAAPPRKSCRATRRRSRGWRTSPASSCTRIRCAPTISIIPTSCASISIRCPASSGRRSARSPRVVRATLDDFGLVGWPKTSGSRGMHVYVRIERRWTFDEVRRAALALAREVERRAPGARDEQVVEGRAPRRVPRLQPEREGPHDRRAPTRCGRRRTRACRRRSPGTRSTRCEPARLHAGDDAGALRGGRRSPRRHRRGSRARSRRCSSCRRGTSAKGWATRRGRRTTGSRPGEPPRVQPSRSAATPKHPLIEIGRAQKKEDALAGLERWKARHPEAAAHLEPADVLVDAMRGRFHDLDAHPRQPAARAGRRCGRRRSRSIPTTTPRRLERRQPERAGRAEDLLELVRRRDLELIVAAVRRRLVGPPALEDGGVAEAVALHVVVLHLAHALDAQRLPRQILAGAPAALAAGHARHLAAVGRRPTRATDDPRARRSRSGASSVDELLARRHRERRGHADVLQRALVVVQPEQQRADQLVLPALCQRKPATTQSAVRACLTLIIARLPGWYVPSSGLAITPSRPAPSKRASHSAASAAIARHRRQVDRRLDVREQPLRAARGARAAASSRRSRPSTASRSNATNDAGVSFASFATRDAAGCSRSCSASKSSPCGVAITISPSTTQPSGSAGEQRVVQLGKVAIERPQIAALDEDVGRRRERRSRESRPTSARRGSRRRRAARRRASRASARSAGQASAAVPVCHPVQGVLSQARCK